MEFGQAIRSCFGKYATFSGRASRSEFWYFSLFVFVTSIVADILDRQLFSSAELFGGPLNLIVSVVTVLPSLAVGSRRLHDTERSGWLQLIMLTIVGIIPLILWWATRGTVGLNRYGADPVPASSSSATATHLN